MSGSGAGADRESPDDDPNVALPTPREILAWRMSNACRSYWEEFSAYADLLETTTRHVAPLDEFSVVTESAREAIAKFDGAAESILAIMSRQADEGDTDTPWTIALLSEIADNHFQEPWGYPVYKALDLSFRRRPRLPIVLNALLVTSVSAFEVLMASVVTEFYRATPQAVEAVPREREKEFSLKDLKNLGTIDAAIDMAVSRRVEELMYGSLSDWTKFFADKLNIDLRTLARDWDTTREILERRHVIVHSGARASRRYVERVETASPKVGDDLSCDEEYLRAALDELLILGLLLAASVSLKFDAGDDERILTELSDIGYLSLRIGQWRVAETVCAFGAARSRTMAGRLLFQVNGSIAKSRQYGIESVRSEVEAWDLSAATRDFRLARACLLGDSDAALTLIPELFQEGRMTREDLLEWPLLDDLREDERFIALVERYKATSDDDLVITAKSKVVHRSGCRRAPASAARVTRQLAVRTGGRACSVCLPVLTPRS